MHLNCTLIILTQWRCLLFHQKSLAVDLCFTLKSRERLFNFKTSALLYHFLKLLLQCSGERSCQYISFSMDMLQVLALMDHPLRILVWMAQVR